MQSTERSPFSRRTSVSLSRQAPPEKIMSISGPAYRDKLTIGKLSVQFGSVAFFVNSYTKLIGHDFPNGLM